MAPAAAPRRLQQQRGPTFSELGFDPEVKPGEDYADRMRQYRNAVQRFKGKAGGATEGAAADLGIPALMDSGGSPSEETPEEDDRDGSVGEVANSQAGSDSGGELIDMNNMPCPLCGAEGCDPTWCDDAGDTPPSTPQQASTARHAAPDGPRVDRGNVVVAGSPLAKNLGGAMAAAAEHEDEAGRDAADVGIGRLSLNDEAAGAQAVAKMIAMKPGRSRTCRRRNWDTAG